MGIKNLIKVIQKYAPEAIKITSIENYKNTVIGIDANLMIYKMIYAIRLNGYDIKNGQTSVTHIHALLLKMIGFSKYNITPVFVFDSMPPSIKNDTLQKRTDFKNFMRIKYYKAVTQDEKKKYYFAKSDITLEEIEECMKIIELFGYTVVESKEEADSELAYLMKHKKIDYIATDDMDILVFGGKKILKNFTISSKKKIQEIDLDIFLKKSNLTMDQLIELSILLGCDYCPNIKGIGPIKSYKYITEYKNIKTISQKTDIVIPSVYQTAYDYFKNHPVNDNQIKVNKKAINKKGLDIFLIDKGYDKEYIEKLYKKLNLKNNN